MHAQGQAVAAATRIDIGQVRGATWSAQRTIELAREAIDQLSDCFHDPDFTAAFDRLVAAIVASPGRVVVTGMGKSGAVARKIAATLTSTGTPAMYLHPADAVHGDIGMVTSDDVVIMLIRSGETAEFFAIVDYCRCFQVALVAVTSAADSSIGRAADVSLMLPAVTEACAHDLVPTTSTTVQLVFGDALAMALMDRRGFTKADFVALHPGGRLGAQLLKVGRIMARGADVPRVTSDATLLDATIEMTRARLGGTAVVGADGALLGAFTDGDLRRAMTSGRGMDDSVSAHMTRAPRFIGPQDLASEALRRMHAESFQLLFVCDDDRLVGAIHLHDVLRAGVA